MTEREEFLDIFHRYVTRPGSEKLLDWLDTKTDFFTAPASTRFHGAYDGGLCAHSLNVYRVLRSSFFEPDTDTEETTPSSPCSTTCARPTSTKKAPAT